MRLLAVELAQRSDRRWWSPGPAEANARPGRRATLARLHIQVSANLAFVDLPDSCDDQFPHRLSLMIGLLGAPCCDSLSVYAMSPYQEVRTTPNFPIVQWPILLSDGVEDHARTAWATP